MYPLKSEDLSMPVLLDCTFRDGGYYNSWDFSCDLIAEYLSAMEAIAADYVEIGFRSLDKRGFKGGAAYSTDAWIRSLAVPDGLKIGVMVNASEVVNHPAGLLPALAKMFVSAEDSPVSLVRLACHVRDFRAALPACAWLKGQGYRVGINLMQIADLTLQEVEEIGKIASDYSPDVLYFADSMGSMNPEQTAKIIRALRAYWQGDLGIHTHDNMGQALANTMRAIEDGVKWVDSTVAGMGRGPGNAKTEYLAIAMDTRRSSFTNITPLLSLITKHFGPMHTQYGWGSNPYYYLAGKYGIHPTFIQEMLADPRFGEVDLLAVIDHLREAGGKKYSLTALEKGLHFFVGEPTGSWAPVEFLSGKEVLLVGTGPGAIRHRQAIENYVRVAKPVVIALNTQQALGEEYIDVRVASHPVRLLEDCHTHLTLPHPLITPVSMLPDKVRTALQGKDLLDFGFSVEKDTFRFGRTHCTLPTSLVVAYALAITASGGATRVLMAGFDGYTAEDPRTIELERLLSAFQATENAPPLIAITPTRYGLPIESVYSLLL